MDQLSQGEGSIAIGKEPYSLEGDMHVAAESSDIQGIWGLSPSECCSGKAGFSCSGAPLLEYLVEGQLGPALCQHYRVLK